MARASKEDYTPMHARSDHSLDGSEEDAVPFLHPQSQPPASPSRCSRICLLLGVVLLALSNIVSLLIGGFVGRKTVDLDRSCAAHTTQYSPVLKDVDIKYSLTQFNGSFMQEEIYRKAGSPEVDAAWEALGVDYRAGLIAAEDGPRSGLTSGHVQRADKYGGGYFVNVEGMHHLHCLNLVRKSLYYNYPYYKDLGTHAFVNDDEIFRLHASHCLDMLRQVLMCNVDTGVLGQVWYLNEGKPVTFPDFNTRHKCKNYDAVRQWAEKLQAPPPNTLPPDYLKAPDAGDVGPVTP